MLRACVSYIIAAWLMVAAAGPAWAVDVLDGCREVSKEGTLLLLDLSCKSSKDCWPDPDDVDLVNAATGKSTGWAVSDIVWLDPSGKILDKMPTSYPMRAVWDLSSVGEKLPGKVRLEYEDEDLTGDIVLKNSCRHFPKELLARFDAEEKKP